MLFHRECACWIIKEGRAGSGETHEDDRCGILRDTSSGSRSSMNAYPRGRPVPNSGLCLHHGGKPPADQARPLAPLAEGLWGYSTLQGRIKTCVSAAIDTSLQGGDGPPCTYDTSIEP